MCHDKQNYLQVIETRLLETLNWESEPEPVYLTPSAKAGNNQLLFVDLQQ